MLLTAAAVVAGCSQSTSDGTLTNRSARGGVCQSAAGAQDWATRQTVPTMFGLADIVMKGSKSVVVDSVEATDNHGVPIFKTAFVRGGVGSGSAYGDIAYTAGAQSWASRVDLPSAVLAPVDRTAGSTIQYQIVVGVLPTGPDGGSASGVDVT